ncbi:Hypothetical protein R9X50_00575900 [Acrodontium crateriforme]|uniref:Zinc transporter n=1 Tax=Acrodontium crateriforme TaxID=150365 RepID=A0AAQ3MAB4_9PEZI|nr:Hypothetical protein R9X50_00575900 [Acrodontium crateriforme]
MASPAHRHDDHYDSPAPAIQTELDYDLQQGINESPRKTPKTPLPADSLLSPDSAFSTPLGAGISQSAFFSPIIPNSSNLDGRPSASEAAAGGHQPFNFVPQQYVADGATPNKSDAMGKRRGHKYRHSSIHASVMDSIMKAPPAYRAPLTVPASLPMPTRKEAWWSMTTNQTARLVWCLCHFAVSALVQFSGASSLSMTALSRLLLFDAAGAIVCVAVDVMGNFEVWQRSSLKHPFGLERADVLAGFGLAVFIAFMGLDIISHGVQHSLENLGSHVAHSSHAHTRVTAGSVDVASVLAIASTLVSALLLKNHSRVGKAMRVELIASWGKILGNPSHFLTLSCSVVLLILPWLSISTYKYFDLSFAFIIALLMIAFGVRLGTSLASMLLMSYRPAGHDKYAVRDVIADIEHEPGVSSVEEARFWQVHYGLCMANVKLKYRSGNGYGDEVTRLRQRVTSIIRQGLGGVAGVKWDISLQLAIEKD